MNPEKAELELQHILYKYGVSSNSMPLAKQALLKWHSARVVNLIDDLIANYQGESKGWDTNVIIPRHVLTTLREEHQDG